MVLYPRPGAAADRGSVRFESGYQGALRSDWGYHRGGPIGMEHAFGLDIPLTLSEICNPRRTAVLVYDMQAGVVSQISNGRQVVERVLRVLQAARDGGYRVFFTRLMSLPNEVAGVTQLRTAMAWQHVDRAENVRPAFLRDTPGFQIAQELAPLP